MKDNTDTKFYNDLRNYLYLTHTPQLDADSEAVDYETEKADDTSSSREYVNKEWKDKKKELLTKSGKIANTIKEAREQINKERKRLEDRQKELTTDTIFEEGTLLRTLSDKECTHAYNKTHNQMTMEQDTYSDDVTEPGTTSNRVDHPSYYNLENGPFIILDKDYKAGDIIRIECIDVIRNMPTWKGNVIKYVWRCGEKEEEGLTQQQKEIEDAEKGYWYLGDKIKEMKALLKK